MCAVGGGDEAVGGGGYAADGVLLHRVADHKRRLGQPQASLLWCVHHRWALFFQGWSGCSWPIVRAKGLIGQAGNPRCSTTTVGLLSSDAREWAELRRQSKVSCAATMTAPKHKVMTCH